MVLPSFDLESLGDHFTAENLGSSSAADYVGSLQIGYTWYFVRLTKGRFFGSFGGLVWANTARDPRQTLIHISIYEPFITVCMLIWKDVSTSFVSLRYSGLLFYAYLLVLHQKSKKALVTHSTTACNIYAVVSCYAKFR